MTAIAYHSMRLFLRIGLAAAALASSVGLVSAQSAAGICDGQIVESGRSVRDITHDGRARSYRLYVPSGYDAVHPVPLVLSLHGFASNAFQQEMYSGWDAVADEFGFIVAYPQGEGSPPRWNAGSIGLFSALSPSAADDVAFIRAVVAQIQSEFCINPSSIYVNGMSNGGGMSNRLACEAADLFAAAGMVAGAYTEFGGCYPARHIPIIAFHGTSDALVPYEGQRRLLPPIEEWAGEWAARNECSLTPILDQVTEQVSSRAYTNCASAGNVILYTIEGGGHTWPGAVSLGLNLLGATTQDISATRAMWQFFAEHPMQDEFRP